MTDTIEFLRIVDLLSAQPLTVYSSLEGYNGDIRVLEKNCLVLKERGQGEYDYGDIFLSVAEVFDRLLRNIYKNNEILEKKYEAKLRLDILKQAGYSLDSEALIRDGINGSVAETALLPAACIPCYAELQGANLNSNLTCITTRNNVYRREKEYSLFRLKNFQMRELVFIGGKDEVKSALDDCKNSIEALSRDLDFSFVMASSFDSFIGSHSDIIKSYQVLFKTKIELQAFVPGLIDLVPICSINFHGTHFSKDFKIKAQGEIAYSGCVGFGIERWVMLFFSRYGLDRKFWPEKIASLYEKPSA